MDSVEYQGAEPSIPGSHLSLWLANPSPTVGQYDPATDRALLDVDVQLQAAYVQSSLVASPEAPEISTDVSRVDFFA